MFKENHLEIKKHSLPCLVAYFLLAQLTWEEILKHDTMTHFQRLFIHFNILYTQRQQCFVCQIRNRYVVIIKLWVPEREPRVVGWVLHPQHLLCHDILYIGATLIKTTLSHIKVKKHSNNLTLLQGETTIYPSKLYFLTHLTICRSNLYCGHKMQRTDAEETWGNDVLRLEGWGERVKNKTGPKTNHCAFSTQGKHHLEIRLIYGQVCEAAPPKVNTFVKAMRKNTLYNSWQQYKLTWWNQCFSWYNKNIYV